MATARQLWKKLLKRLPPATLEVVERELAQALQQDKSWTQLRPFLPGEPISGQDVVCQGDWPVDGKGKLKPCEGVPAHIQYAAGGSAHGMGVIVCGECAAKFADPSFDWDGPGKARC